MFGSSIILLGFLKNSHLNRKGNMSLKSPRRVVAISVKPMEDSTVNSLRKAARPYSASAATGRTARSSSKEPFHSVFDEMKQEDMRRTLLVQNMIQRSTSASRGSAGWRERAQQSADRIMHSRLLPSSPRSMHLEKNDPSFLSVKFQTIGKEPNPRRLSVVSPKATKQKAADANADSAEGGSMYDMCDRQLDAMLNRIRDAQRAMKIAVPPPPAPLGVQQV